MGNEARRAKMKPSKGGRLLLTAAAFLAVGVGLFLLRSERAQAPSPGSFANDGRVPVVTSFYPLYYFASRVGGEHAAVINITPAGAEPHDYEPTAQDVAAMEDSKLLILLGTGLESWGSRMAKNLHPERTLVVSAGQDLMTGHMVEEGESIVDPHVWLSPALAEKMVDRITNAYESVDAPDAAAFRANAAALKNDLDSLDADYRKGLETCAKKDIVTSHAAFGYLARDYGFNQVPIAGLSPDAEPSPKDLADISAFVRQNKIDILFFESLVSPKLAETIAAETGAKTLVLDPIEGLQQDAMAQGQDYLSVMRNNLANLRAALQCHM
jgi:zinc transport system substrate-binding protein